MVAPIQLIAIVPFMVIASIRSHRLGRRLKYLGYRNLTRWAHLAIWKARGRAAYHLPAAEQALTVPGYSGDSEGIIRLADEWHEHKLSCRVVKDEDDSFGQW